MKFIVRTEHVVETDGVHFSDGAIAAAQKADAILHDPSESTMYEVEIHPDSLKDLYAKPKGPYYVESTDLEVF